MIKYNLKFPTSVYSALEFKDKIYVGGSNWNRRKIPHGEKIAIQRKTI